MPPCDGFRSSSASADIVSRGLGVISVAASMDESSRRR